jgi:hypothetical protein
MTIRDQLEVSSSIFDTHAYQCLDSPPLLPQHLPPPLPRPVQAETLHSYRMTLLSKLIVQLWTFE